MSERRPAVAPSEAAASEGADMWASPTTSPQGERYRRGAVIGLGGMGRVILAHDARLGRDVALKEVAHDGDPSLRARLLHEAAIVARLDHPGIVPVHDVGERDDGSVFIAMRVVRGQALDALVGPGSSPPIPLRGQPLRDLRAIRALLAAAEAVGWAHAMGIVHRDLKPANIMVGEFGETQVIDWGLAHVLGEPSLERPGSVVGTPGFRAPEQDRGQAADQRSDVWSLGAILRALTSGHDSPELAAIVRKATSPSPDDRYRDAKAFAIDLERYLDGRRVAAHSYSTWQLVRRVARAWRAQLIIAAVALLVVVLGLVQLVRTNDAARARAEADAERLRLALATSDQHLARALVDEAAAHAAQDARPEAELLAAEALRLSESPLARGVLASFAGPRPRRLEERQVQGCADVLAADGTTRCRGTVSRPFRYVGEALSARWDAGFVTIVRGRDEATWQPCVPHVIDAVAIDEVADRIVIACRDRLRVGALSTMVLADRPLPALATITAVAFRGHDAFVFGTSTGEVALVAGDVVHAAHNDGPVREVGVSVDGALAFVLGERGGVRLWHVASGSWLGRLPQTWSRHARFGQAPDELWTLGTGEGDSPSLGARVVRWHLPRRPTTWAFGDGVTAVAPSDDIAVAHGLGVQVIDRASGITRWASPSRVVVKGVAWLDGALVAADAGGLELARWTRDGRVLPALVGGEALRARRIGVVDGALLALAYEPLLSAIDPDLRLNEVQLSTIAAEVFLDLATDGSTAVVLRESARAVCRVSGRVLEVCVSDPEVVAVGIGFGGEVMFAAHAHEVVAWDAYGALLRVFSAPLESVVTEVAMSPDGRYVAAGDRDGTIWLWRFDGALVLRFPAHTQRVTSLVFEDDTLFSGAWDKTLRMHDLSVIDRTPDAIARELTRAWGQGVLGSLLRAR